MIARIHIFAFAAAVLWPGCGAPKPPTDVPASPGTLEVSPTPDPRRVDRVVFETPKGPAAVQVEVAATRSARAKGLMGREVLAAGSGMLFVFDTPEVQTFWMRNTLIPLDMIFIAGEPTGKRARVVGIVHEATPHSTQIRSVDQASRFVVEVPGGWAAAQGIAPGVVVRFGAATQ